MKKILTISIFTFLFSFALVAQRKEIAWDYPIKPGMKKWNQLITEKERIAAVQIPKDVLVKLSAEDAVKLCISFPSFGYFTAFNTPQEGFLIMLERFNIFRYILSKKDAGRDLISVYKDAGMSGFKTMPYTNDFWAIKLDYIELLLSQKEILQSLTPLERLDLLSETKKKLSEKVKADLFASVPGIQSTVRIMLQILNLDASQKLRQSSKKQAMDIFAETGIAENIELIDEVVRIVDNFYK
jgi:uncharacterized protein (UPF0335 family)